MMDVLVDYTRFEIGMAVSARGEIAECPVCGRNGERRRGEHTVYVHLARLEPRFKRGARIKYLSKCVWTPGRGYRRDEIALAVLLWLLGGNPVSALSEPSDYALTCEWCNGVVNGRRLLRGGMKLCRPCAEKHADGR
jgi:hypothetical protein